MQPFNSFLEISSHTKKNKIVSFSDKKVIGQLRQKKAQLQKELELIQHSQKDLKEYITYIENEHDSLEQEHRSLKQDLEKKKSDKKYLRERIKDLQKKINSLQQENDNLRRKVKTGCLIDFISNPFNYP